jgi:uncharacterized protein YjbI with pentapeptide repeats
MHQDAIHHRPKLARKDVLGLIDSNGGSEGLDLSGYDLSGINLSKLNLHGIIFGNIEILQLAETEDVITKSANLDGAWLERSNLQRANFGRVSMKGASFFQSDLTEATLWVANAEGSTFSKANLSRANLYGTVLRDCKLVQARLEGANLDRADLTGIHLSMESIGSELLQENQAEYRQYYARWYVSPKVRELFEDHGLQTRYIAAVEVYLGLKNAFMSSGRYKDASWAYIKERQMERKTYYPLVARYYYGSELPTKCSTQSFRWWRFHLKYTIKWCLNWVADLLVGYGERPLRAASCGGVAIVVFALAFWLSGGVSNPNGQPIRWIDYLHYSLATFSTIGFPALTPGNDLAKLLTSLEALTGISLLALLMFSLGNRINRS